MLQNYGWKLILAKFKKAKKINIHSSTRVGKVKAGMLENGLSMPQLSRYCDTLTDARVLLLNRHYEVRRDVPLQEKTVSFPAISRLHPILSAQLVVKKALSWIGEILTSEIGVDSNSVGKMGYNLPVDKQRVPYGCYSDIAILADRFQAVTFGERVEPIVPPRNETPLPKDRIKVCLNTKKKESKITFPDSAERMKQNHQQQQN
ncbi:hypothetical protein MAR_025969 [Mya arenaria]|uniref:Uncharacterized protein n=1 Tax=Mya arenaria TaxID=6604 RepID=A0ABY7ERN3_MYAAR|nr:hypothetical protein MAR_025969 [Mya arenaria]